MGKLVSIVEAARRFGLTEQTMRNWIEKGYIDVKSVGKARYIDEDTINALQDTVEDVIRQQSKLERVRNVIRQEREQLERDREEENTRRRYTNFLVGEAFRNGFFGTMVRLLEKCEDLTSREAGVLIEYLNGATLEAIANKYMLTRERMRQIIEKAIRKTRTLTSLEQRIDDIKFLKADNDALKATIVDLKKKLREQEEMDYIVNLKDEEEKKKAIMANDEVCKVLVKKISDTNLSVRAMVCLRTNDIETIGDLCKYQKLDILKFRNLGRKTLTELEYFLESLGLHWGTDIDMIYKQRVAVLLSENKNV